MTEENGIKPQMEIHEPLILEQFHHEILKADKTEQLNAQSHELETQTELKNEIQTDHIPFKLKILFSLPAFSKMSCLLILNVHAMIFYESKGSSLLLISFFTALARCIEIILKPLIAHWSDNSKFAMGRRKPFMLFGCGFYAIFLVLIFTPPYERMSAIAESIWFGAFYVFFFVADTLCNIPYQALGPEMSRDTREREKLYMVFYFFQYIGVLFASVAPVIIQKFFKACECSSCDGLTDLEKVKCKAECQSLCSVQNNEDSLVYMCMFVGLFFVFSILLLCNVIKERKGSLNKEKSYLVPTLFRMISNEPFMSLLVPWIIDATITQIFATMLPFFISFVINPQQYCIKNNIELNSEICNTNSWIGATIFAFFFFCIGFTALWHWLVQSIGKKKAWQAYSLISIVSFSLFLICDQGMMFIMILLSIFNSFPAGGGYLNDVMVSDSIDYDEFVTGKRNEGIYIVFSSFTPKIVGVFAQSIPLSIMSLIGFIPSQNGQINEQPSVVVEFIRFYFIAVPVLLALVSFLFKMKYPIDSDIKMLNLKNAINIQSTKAEELKERGVDFYKIHNPIYNNYHVQIFCNNEEQAQTKIVADHFYDIEYLILLLKHDYHTIRNKLIALIIGLIIVDVFFSIVLVYTFRYLEVKSLTLIPLVCLFIITIAFVILMVNVIRLRVINKVIKNELMIDEKYLTLYIYQMKKTRDECTSKENLCNECGKMSAECCE